MHHISIRTADIHRAIAFYEALGFRICERFTAGYTLACWMEGQADLTGRIELIQVPQPKPAPDPFGDEHYVGYYHLSFDLTGQSEDLPTWLDQLQSRSEQPLRILLPPTQQMIGSRVYEMAFIADGDGMPIELLRQMTPP
jgi:catechol 2,3-dioxygenase-like lactoylglutathione lyase family enzyme